MEFPPVRSEWLGVVTEVETLNLGDIFTVTQKKQKRRKEGRTNKKIMGKNPFWGTTFCSS